MITEPVALSLISAFSGIAIAYIVNIAAKKVQKKKAMKQPKDRMEQMFDGYERLIKSKDVEDDRKQRYILVIEKELALTKEHVARLENALEATSEELEQSRVENQQLRDMLENMRKEYKYVKGKHVDELDSK